MIPRFLTVSLALPLCLLLVTPGRARAQGTGEALTFRIHSTFYADNTEFSNPYRLGETLFGSNHKIFLDAPIASNVHLMGGVFTDQHYGSEHFLEFTRPIAALRVGSLEHYFLFGTLVSSQLLGDRGPDQNTPHGLLPVLQTEDLTFTRAYETGMQWKADKAIWHQDTWVNWQQVNTPLHREVLDTGNVTTVLLHRGLKASFQSHMFHAGGQLYASGAVADSQAFGPGVIYEQPIGAVRIISEVHGLLGHDVANRQANETRVWGKGAFVRESVQTGRWRGHVIVWRAKDFRKTEGDPNYNALRRDGTYTLEPRNYQEMGVARVFQPADTVQVQSSLRVHRIERHVGYSFRILGIVDVSIARK